MVDSRPLQKASPRLRLIVFATGAVGGAGIPLTIMFDSGPRFRSIWLTLALGAEIALTIGGLILAVRLGRRENVSIAKIARPFAFLEAFALTVLSPVFSEYRPVPGMEHCQGTGIAYRCTQVERIHTSPAAIALLVSAAALIFISLIFAPSSEHELSKRIDLEACGVALPISFFFFLFYEAFQRGLSLPHFTPRLAAITLLASYLFARLGLTIRYR